MLIDSLSFDYLSDKINVLPASKTELSLSKTESLANDISSINKSPPYLIELTKIPSYHSNI